MLQESQTLGSIQLHICVMALQRTEACKRYSVIIFCRVVFSVLPSHKYATLSVTRD